MPPLIESAKLYLDLNSLDYSRLKDNPAFTDFSQDLVFEKLLKKYILNKKRKSRSKNP